MAVLSAVSHSIWSARAILSVASHHLAYSLASGLGVDWTELAQNERADRPVWIQLTERP
jgi:hypothetical protein